MKSRSPTFKDLELDIVGSTVFGRYPKISVEQTFNMIISDGWIVDYAGFVTAIANVNPDGIGRGIKYINTINNVMVVIGNGVYLISPNLTPTLIGQLTTFTGDVFIALDIQANVQICDKESIYNYNTGTGLFTTLTLDFRPGYVAFHNSRFISVDLNSSEWRLSDPLSANQTYPPDAQHVGEFQTKADRPLVVFQISGRSNNIIILGSIVGQFWTDVGAALFPYQLNSGVNIDYGIVSADTFASLDNYNAWVGINDRAGPVIMVSTGDIPQRLSNDGIDFKLASLTTPSDSHGFMFRQDGHVFYQVTFPTDNFSLTYDFNTGKFFTITDAYMNYHPAKGVAYFNETYYFVSLNNGNLYEMSTNDTTYDGQLIPRVRVCKTLRMPDTAPFVVNNLSFPLEQGIDGSQYNNQITQVYGPNLLMTESGNYIITENGLKITTEPNYAQPNSSGVFSSIAAQNPPLPAVDLSISNDGGQSFSNFDRMQLNPIGLRRNRFIYYNLGWSNEFTPQFRFWSQGRIVAGNGTVSAYQ